MACLLRALAMNEIIEDFFIPQAEPVAPPKEEPKAQQPLSPSLKIYMVAGEASGDLIGSHLMKELKSQLRHPILFYGVGGDRMEVEGLHSLFPFHELSLLGVVELLPYLMTIFSRINLVVDDVLNKRPDVLITIDSPGFTLRVVEKLLHTNRSVPNIAPSCSITCLCSWNLKKNISTMLVYPAPGSVIPL